MTSACSNSWASELRRASPPQISQASLGMAASIHARKKQSAIFRIEETPFEKRLIHGSNPHSHAPLGNADLRSSASRQVVAIAFWVVRRSGASEILVPKRSLGTRGRSQTLVPKLRLGTP